jgi:hypothetical protein
VAGGQRFADLLRLLTRHGVDFVVVGAAAAVLDGAPITTFDLDVVFETSAENRARLLAALEEIDAVYLDPLDRRILPTDERLQAHRLNLFTTRLGRFDALTAIAPEQTWGELLPRSHTLEIGGAAVRVLDLDAVIESKEAAGRDKDRAALPLLRETLRLKGLRDAN